MPSPVVQEVQLASPATPAAQPIGEIAVTPRPLSDYRNMFLLEERDLLAGPILDCPGGASPFGAQVRARGGTVVSVDPVYDCSSWPGSSPCSSTSRRRPSR